jgi:hypothetical protein
MMSFQGRYDTLNNDVELNGTQQYGRKDKQHTANVKLSMAFLWLQ